MRNSKRSTTWTYGRLSIWHNELRRTPRTRWTAPGTTASLRTMSPSSPARDREAIYPAGTLPRRVRVQRHRPLPRAVAVQPQRRATTGPFRIVQGGRGSNHSSSPITPGVVPQLLQRACVRSSAHPSPILFGIYNGDRSPASPSSLDNRRRGSCFKGRKDVDVPLLRRARNFPLLC